MGNANSAGKSARGATPTAHGAAHGAAPAAPRRLSLLGLVYGVYSWLLFLLAAALVLPALLLTPQLSRRRALVSGLARLALRLAGMRLQVHGLGQLPQPCIVVANHSSYLDGVVLAATLPPCFSFVIKREMSAVPLAGTLLRRIGAEFVERGDRVRGARDARRLLRNAAIGHSLVFFPEGTFSTEVGLLRFHIGAFAAAVRANLPVVPVAIRGTRHCLAPGSPWPRPGTVRIEALAALPSLPSAGGKDDRDQALLLRNAARGALLAVLGEADLEPELAANSP
jgi:1-acyl-sn-glycerol-3-phosphate acyltransferase